MISNLVHNARDVIVCMLRIFALFMDFEFMNFPKIHYFKKNDF